MYEEESFFSFNKRTDWQNGIADNLEISDEGLTIKQTLRYGIDDSINLSVHAGFAMVNDFTLGKNERIYLLDETSSIWTYDYRNKHSEFLIKDQQMFTNKAMLASIADLLFIAEPSGRIVAYSLSNSQIMWIRTEWHDRILYPLAVATGLKAGHLFVVVPTDVEIGEDAERYIPSGGKFFVLELNVSGEVISTYENKSFQLKARRKLLHIKYQIILDVAINGNVYVFDKEDATMYEFTNDEAEKVLFTFSPAKQYSGICSDSNQRFFIGDSRYWDTVGEDDRFIISVNEEGIEKTIISSYRGRVDKMLIDHFDRIFVWDGQQQLLTILSLKQRTLERDSTKLLEGVFISTAIDTKEDKTSWHKLLVDVELPRETKITISYYAADDCTIFSNGQHIDLNERIKDENMPFSEKEKLLQPLWTNEISNPTDALLFNAEGRFLWFKIKLIGSEKQTPFVKKMRIYFPRTSYLSYLPAFYQEDRTSSEFLERFLSLFAKFLSGMDEQIQGLANYFDPNLVSGEFLKWLSYWLGISVDDSWSDKKLRELMHYAPYLYKKRGTKEAIAKIVEIYTGDAPFIIEHFQLKLYKQDSHLHRVIANLYGDNPYFFYVLVKPNVIHSEKERMMVQQILDAEKPAFTEAKLIVLEPWIYLDMHSYLGVNTYLSERSLMTLNHKSYMPTDTLLIDLERDNRFDIHTRMGLDSKLE